MQPLTHPIEREELMAYLDGELPLERAASVAAHLEHCAECAALASELRSLSHELAAWQVEPARTRLTGRVTAALNEVIQKQKDQKAPHLETGLIESSRPLVPRWVLGLAVTLAIFVIIVAIAIPNLLRSRIASDRASQIARERASQSGMVVDQASVSSPERPLEPMIVRTASLTLVTKDFEDARASVERIVRQYRGYIAQLTVSGHAGGSQTLTGTLRIPANQLDAALTELKKLGRVEEESQGGEEVTQQYVDLSARLSNARNTEQRLIAILQQRTGKVSEVLEVEREISRVRGEIERMDAELKALAKRVSYATLQLRIGEEYKATAEVAPPSTGRRLRNAMVEGYKGLTESAVGLLEFLLSFGPSLLFWGLVIFFPARFAWRRLRATRQ